MGVALLSWIPGGGLGERAHFACRRTRVHGARSALSPALRIPGHCSGAALASAAGRHRSYFPILLALEVKGPEASGLLISSSLSCTGKCWVGQAHAVPMSLPVCGKFCFALTLKDGSCGYVVIGGNLPLLLSNLIHETVRQCVQTCFAKLMTGPGIGYPEE